MILRLCILSFLLFMIPWMVEAQKKKEEAPVDSTLLRKVQIKKIYITGNKKTKAPIIHRELSFAVGDVVSLHDLGVMVDLDEKKIFNTRLFEEVKVTILELSDVDVDVLIEVRERWYFFPIPIVPN